MRTRAVCNLVMMFGSGALFALGLFDQIEWLFVVIAVCWAFALVVDTLCLVDGK